MDANGAIVAIGSTAAIATVVVMVMIWLREGRDDGRQPAQDPCDGAYRESLLVRDETGYLTPGQATAFIELLEETTPASAKHCPVCIILMCDEWGIPLEQVRTTGKREYCRDHRHSILAHARQGA